MYDTVKTMKNTFQLDDLNREQKQAVMHKGAPLLVVAGPGTGKTTVITHRIAWLILAQKIDAEHIAALTFTDKAANEMQERVDRLLPYGYTQTFIGTFHRFGEQLLRKYALEAGLPANFRILNEVETINLVRTHLFNMDLKSLRPLGNPTKYASALVKVIGRAKDELVTLQEYQKWAARLPHTNKAERLYRQRHIEIARAYAFYEDLMAQEGLIDFADLVVKPYHLLHSRPDLLARVRAAYQYLVVDEFQDTNVAQNELMMLISGNRGNVMVVGDDDQAIYKFRGASLSNMLDFKERFPRAKIITLKKNYRSTQQILNSAYRLIQYNNPDRLETTLGINKRLIGGGAGIIVQHLATDTGRTEVEVVAELIGERRKILKIHWSDCAILVRSHAQAEPFIEALLARGIPIFSASGHSFFRNMDSIVLTAALRTISNTFDDQSIYLTATSWLYNISGSSLTALSSLARTKRVGLWRLIQQEIFPDELNKKERTVIEAFAADIKKLQDLAPTKNAGEVLYALLEGRGILETLTGGESAQAQERLTHIARYFDIIRDFIHNHAQAHVTEFVEYLGLAEEQGEVFPETAPDPDEDAVRVLTVHAAKGLEFTVVVLANLVADRFPTRERGEGLAFPDELIKERLPESGAHLKEERRLFYVGLTRAKLECYLSSAVSYGGVRTKRVSPFVLEATDVAHAKGHAITRSEQKRIKTFAPTKRPTQKPAYTALKSLSSYQIFDYLTCPLKYHYIHRLRIPILKHHSIQYGSAMHSAIAFLFQELIAARVPKLEAVIKEFNRNWESVGFLSREHEKARLKEGHDTLALVYDTFKTGEVPLQVETPFRFPYKKISIRGVIDIVFGSKKAARIVDFKTSEVGSEEEADRRARDSIQLGVYALAWQELYQHLPAQVQLFFVGSNIYGTLEGQKINTQKVKKKIDTVVEGITKGEFSATPSTYVCEYCPFNRICPYSAVNPKQQP